MNYANSTDSKTVLILGGSGVAEGKVTVNAMGAESGWRAGGGWAEGGRRAEDG